jgi:hypothetical protein
VFIDPLPSNGRPIVVRIGSRGNVFTESLPSNGYTRHNINGTLVFYTEVSCVQFGPFSVNYPFLHLSLVTERCKLYQCINKSLHMYDIIIHKPIHYIIIILM